MKLILFLFLLHLFYLRRQIALSYTVTDRNIAFSDTPVTCYLLSFGNVVVNSDHFLLTENIKDNYIILLFNSQYKRR